MNILILAAIVPYPPHDGDKLRLFHFLRSLKARGHTLDLFCLTRASEDRAAAECLRPWLRNLHVEYLPDHELYLNLLGGIFHDQSWNIASYNSPKFLRVLQNYASTPDGSGIDSVFAYRLRMAPYAVGFLKRRKRFRPDEAPVPWVLDLVDCLSGFARQAASRRGFPRAKRFSARWDSAFLSLEEPGWAGRADASLVVAEPERDELIRLGASANRIHLIPNGVEKPERAGGGRPPEYPPLAPVAAFVGSLQYAPNVDAVKWFLDRVWPLVRRNMPEAVFMAVGGKPDRNLLKRDNGRDVRVRGYVREIGPYLTNAAVTVAPLWVATGFQNKVALSLSHGVPVVATSRATGWIPPDLRGGVTTVDDPEAFASAVERHLRNPRAFRAGARRTGEALMKRFSWEASGRQLDHLLRDLVRMKK